MLKDQRPKTKDQKLLVICGPTAVGKTALAVKLAKKFKGELISADSRQVYKGMDVVSGKDIPENIELRTKNLELGIKDKNYDVGFRTIDGIPVWLVDIVAPKQDFSVAHFVKYAKIVIDDLIKREKLPIIVGGTGLYIKALIDGIETIGIPPNQELRKKLLTKTVKELQEILQKLNPKKFVSMNNSDRNNTRRLIRAIEIEHFKAKSSNYDTAQYHSKANLDILQVGLTASKKILLERIKKRVEERIKLGAFEEVKYLLDKGYSPNLPSMSGDGYKELMQFYQGKLSREQAVEQWIHSDFEHARKQIVWFKKDIQIIWFDITRKNWEQKVDKRVSYWYNTMHDKPN